MNNKSKRFVKQFVLGFGFLSGVWVRIGFDPEDYILGYAHKVLEYVFPGNVLSFWFWIIPILFLGVSIFGSYRNGKILGILAVFIAFMAGLSVPELYFLVLLALAVIVGFIASKRKN